MRVAIAVACGIAEAVRPGIADGPAKGQTSDRRTGDDGGMTPDGRGDEARAEPGPWA